MSTAVIQFFKSTSLHLYLTSFVYGPNSIINTNTRLNEYIGGISMFNLYYITAAIGCTWVIYCFAISGKNQYGHFL